MPATKEAKKSPWKMGGLSTKQLGLKTWQGINDDDVLTEAAALAYFWFFALFPLAICITAMLGVVAGAGSPTANSLADYIVRAIPPEAGDIVRQTIQHTLQASGGGKLTFGLLIALITASSGVVAMMDVLNKVFGVKEGRSFIKIRSIAVGLTIALGVLICSAMLAIIAGGKLADIFAGGAFKPLWQIGQYVVAIFFLLLSYSIVYYFAPNVEHPEWHWVTPGAAVGVFLWILVSVGLRVYLHFSNTYTATYGALGAVMILLLWFYVTGLAVLIGGEINGIIEREGTGKTLQDEPREARPAGKIEREKAQRQAQEEVKPERVA